MTNQLFLVLPIVDIGVYDAEMSHLKTVSECGPSVLFLKLLSDVAEAMDVVGYEEHVMYYDHRRFSELYRRSCQTSDIGQWPESTLLLRFATTMTKIPDGIGTAVVNDVPQDKGIVCAFANLSTKDDALFNEEAFIDAAHVNIKNSNGQIIPARVIKCSRADLYRWFVSNRTPTRKYFSGYRKHTKKVKNESGKVISGLSYSSKEYSAMLHFAVGEHDHNRKFFIDRKKGRLVVFWNQNESEQIYHAYDVALSDKAEIQKIYKDGGQSLMRVVDWISSLW